MFRPTVKSSVKQDNTAAILAGLKDLQKMQAYVGIPEAKASRKDAGINNAQLAYIHTHGIRHQAMKMEMSKSGMKYADAHALYIFTHGSPLFQSPPRPIIEPAIEARGNIEPIRDEMKKAAAAMLSGNKAKALAYLDRAGFVAENASRAWFLDPRNNWAPNAPSTIRRKGSDRPLIDTAQLRKAITHVTTSEGGNQ